MRAACAMTRERRHDWIAAVRAGLIDLDGTLVDSLKDLVRQRTPCALIWPAASSIGQIAAVTSAKGFEVLVEHRLETMNNAPPDIFERA